MGFNAHTDNLQITQSNLEASIPYLYNNRMDQKWKWILGIVTTMVKKISKRAHRFVRMDNTNMSKKFPSLYKEHRQSFWILKTLLDHHGDHYGILELAKEQVQETHDLVSQRYFSERTLNKHNINRLENVTNS
jgi:hypothetical protein